MPHTGSFAKSAVSRRSPKTIRPSSYEISIRPSLLDYLWPTTAGFNAHEDPDSVPNPPRDGLRGAEPRCAHASPACPARPVGILDRKNSTTATSAWFQAVSSPVGRIKLDTNSQIARAAVT